MKDYDDIRGILLEKYALDIANASCHYSTRNYAFVFSMDYCSVVIRVSPAELRTREEVMSEFMWVDDLRQFHTTVCQPYASAKNNAVEEFEVNGHKYRAALFRRAEGKIAAYEDWNNRYFYNAGVSLGKLHKASADGYALGFRYKRRHWHEKATFDFDSFRYTLPDDVVTIMNETKAEVMSIPQSPQTYGMIHGDYWPGNYFTSGDDIWVFDFDDCGYGYFMFDIVTSISSWIQEPTFMPQIRRRDLLYKSGMLDSFRRGYLENYNLPDAAWGDLELFLRLRYMEQLTIMIPVFDDKFKETIGFDMVEVDKKIVLARDSFFDVLDELAQSLLK